MIKAQQIIESSQILNEAISSEDIQALEKRFTSLLKKIDSIKTPDDYSEFYVDWREWGQEFGNLLHIRVLGKTWGGDSLVKSNRSLPDEWYQKTMDLLDEIEWLFNPHLISSRKEPNPKAVEAWLKGTKRVKTEAQKFSKAYFTELKREIKKLGSVPDHYLTTEEEVAGFHFTSTIAENDEEQKRLIADIKKALASVAKTLKHFNLDILLNEARVVANFQTHPSGVPYACVYNVTKDLLTVGRARYGFYWERAIISALGERSWHQFLRASAQQDWEDFVEQGLVRLTQSELRDITKFLDPYIEKGTSFREVAETIVKDKREMPVLFKLKALIKNYDGEESVGAFLDYMEAFIKVKFPIHVKYSQGFVSSRGTDPEVLSWAETLTRYVLGMRINPLVESEFVMAAGLE